MKVRVVVLNYQAAALTLRCLDALDRQTYPRDLFEVVVVDNASGDGLVEQLRRDRPDVRVVANTDNRGFGAGCNAGIRLPGDADAVALVNNDSVPEPGWLAALVATLEAPPPASGRVGAVAGKVLLGDGDTINSVGCELRPGGFNADRGDGAPDDGSFDTPEEVFGFSGASVLLARALLHDVGDLTEDFFLYYEDTDLVWRLRRRGWSVVTSPAAVSRHDRGASAGRGAMFWYHDTRNRLLVLARHAPVPWLLRALAVQAVLLVRGDPLGADRWTRLRALGAVLARSVGLWRQRRGFDRVATVERADVARWLVTDPG